MSNSAGRVVAILLLMFSVMSAGHGAVVRSMEDGLWSNIEWEGSVPRQGDTVIIGTTVVVSGDAPRVTLEVRQGGTVVLVEGLLGLDALVNKGRIELRPRTLALVQGVLDNQGMVIGGGTLGLSGDHARLRATMPV